MTKSNGIKKREDIIEKYIKDYGDDPIEWGQAAFGDETTPIGVEDIIGWFTLAFEAIRKIDADRLDELNKKINIRTTSTKSASDLHDWINKIRLMKTTAEEFCVIDWPASYEVEFVPRIGYVGSNLAKDFADKLNWWPDGNSGNFKKVIYTPVASIVSNRL